MKSTYSITEAQAKFPSLVKLSKQRMIPITRRDDTVAYLISKEDIEAIYETMEILVDPKAMKALRESREGKVKYYPLSALK